jgi:arginase family enzyme
MDPQLAPETGTPSIGGLSYYQTLDLLDYAYRRFQFIGADFVEVAGRGPRPTNFAAHFVAEFMLRFILSHEAPGPFEGAAFHLREESPPKRPKRRR